MDLHHGLETTAFSFPEIDSMFNKPEAEITDPRQPERNWEDILSNFLELGFRNATDATDERRVLECVFVCRSEIGGSHIQIEVIDVVDEQAMPNLWNFGEDWRHSLVEG